MQTIPYASTVGSLLYAMLCTKLDICFEEGMVSRYQSNPGPKYWIVVKHMLKYLRKMRDCVIVLQSVEII